MTQLQLLPVDIFAGISQYLKWEDVSVLLRSGNILLLKKLHNGGVRSVFIEKGFGRCSFIVGSHTSSEYDSSYYYHYSFPDLNLTIANPVPISCVTSLTICTSACPNLDWNRCIFLSSLKSVSVRFAISGKIDETVKNLFEILRNSPSSFTNLECLEISPEGGVNGVKIFKYNLFETPLDLPKLRTFYSDSISICAFTDIALLKQPSILPSSLEILYISHLQISIAEIGTFPQSIQSVKLPIDHRDAEHLIMSLSNCPNLHTLHISVESCSRAEGNNIGEHYEWNSKDLPRSLTDFGYFNICAMQKLDFGSLPPNLRHLSGDSQIMPIDTDEEVALPHLLESIIFETGLNLYAWPNVIIPKKTRLHNVGYIGGGIVLAKDSILEAYLYQTVSFTKYFMDYPLNPKILPKSLEKVSFTRLDPEPRSFAQIGIDCLSLLDIRSHIDLGSVTVWPPMLTKLTATIHGGGKIFRKLYTHWT